MKYIKGFDSNLCCKGMQFEIGKEYKIDSKKEDMRLCTNTVFHFCKSIQQVHNFYSVLEKNRFCEIEVLGDLVEDKNKCGSNHIKIIREIKGNELNKLLGRINGNTGIFNTGHHNTGDHNTGDCNTGHHNTGDCNTGDCNTGDHNTGDCNTGDCNTGDCNTGHWNTGDRNTGDRNTGDWNTCNRSTGFFNTKEQNIMMFNKDSGMTYKEFYYTDMYDALFSSSFKLTEWFYYTDEEKENSPIRQCTGGYLKKYTFKEACTNWWAGMSDDNKALVQQLPNFNATIFEEITGIEI